MRKFVFNKVVAEPNAGGLELACAKFLDDAPGVASFAKNDLAIGFKLDDAKADSDLSNYIPNFIVKTVDSTIWIVETKGRAELDLPRKMARLAQWCDDAGAADPDTRYHFVYVDEAGFKQYCPDTMAALAASLRGYQPETGAGNVHP